MNIKRILIAISFNLYAQDELKLVWEENFNGDKLEMDSWNHELGDGCPNLCGWGNNELQIYTNKNHRVEDGKLIITVKKKIINTLLQG